MQTEKTSQQKAAAITGIIKCIGDTLKEAGCTPAGTLYAALMQQGCTLEQYQLIEDAFISAGKVKKVSNLLYWID